VEQEHGTKVAEDPPAVFVVQHGVGRQGQRVGRPRAADTVDFVGRLGDRFAVVTVDHRRFRRSHRGARHVACPTERAKHRQQQRPAAAASPSDRRGGHVVHVLRTVAVAVSRRRRRRRRNGRPVFVARRVRPVPRPAATVPAEVVPMPP